MQVGSLSFLYSFLDEQIKYSVRNNPSLTAPGTMNKFRCSCAVAIVRGTLGIITSALTRQTAMHRPLHLWFSIWFSDSIKSCFHVCVDLPPLFLIFQSLPFPRIRYCLCRGHRWTGRARIFSNSMRWRWISGHLSINWGIQLDENKWDDANKAYRNKKPFVEGVYEKIGCPFLYQYYRQGMRLNADNYLLEFNGRTVCPKFRFTPVSVRTKGILYQEGWKDITRTNAIETCLFGTKNCVVKLGQSGQWGKW